MDFYAGATATSLFALTEDGKVYRVTNVAAVDMDRGAFSYDVRTGRERGVSQKLTK